MDKELRRELILEHYEHPVHKGLVEDDSYILKNTNNDSCIDNIDMMMKIEDNVIKDMVFDGEACAICTSATSMIIKKLIGKTKEEALIIMKNYQNMINEEAYDYELLGELNAYDEIYMQPNRKTCALLPSKAVLNIINELEQK